MNFICQMIATKQQAIELIQQKLESLKQKISANIEASGQAASGNTQESLRVETSENSVTLFGRRAFGILETGRKAGKVPYNFVSIILDWMRDKNIIAEPMPYLRTPSERWQPKYDPQTRGQLSLAGAIAHKIKIEGTVLNRIGGRSDIYSNEIPKTISEIKSEILQTLKTEIINIKIN